MCSNLPTGNLPTGNLPTGNLPTGNLPTGNLPTGNLPAGNLPAGKLRIKLDTAVEPRYGESFYYSIGYLSIGKSPRT